MSASIGDSTVLGAAGDASVAGAREVRSLDDRLTLLGMRMTYVALTFGVASFYFAFIYLDLINQNGLWLPHGMPRPPLGIGIAEMALVQIAGLAYFWGQWAGLYERNFARLQLGLAIASVCGLVAVILHIVELHSHNFGVENGAYASVFVALEGVFTGLLLLSVLALLGVTNRARLGLFQHSGIAVEAFGEYWGWIAAIALANFFALYVVPFLPV